jgi:hypothetical protein
MKNATKFNLSNANRQKFCRIIFEFFPVPCKSHMSVPASHLLILFNTVGNQISKFMTNHESKLVKKLERRLKDHVLQAKNNIHRQIESKGVDAIIPAPIRIHHPMIQRAQFYTGDA